MSLYVTSLNSGSNGNCYYIGNDKEAVLIDAGISCRETERRMRGLHLSMDKVKAIFISHEHIDHIKGVYVLSKKYNLPVYVTVDTRRNSRVQFNESLVKNFAVDECIQVGALTVIPFSKHHDAADPYSFVIEHEHVTVGVFTDIGHVCESLSTQFSRCHAAFLEANYDADMLETGRYPLHLKQRIRGGKGHLSNAEALELFLKQRPPHMTHLFLSHLSQENNRPELVAEIFNEHAAGVHIAVASRHQATDVYHIQAKDTQRTVKPLRYKQATLF